MNKELVEQKNKLENYKNTDEYKSLVEDSQAIITEGVFRSRQELIDTYKGLGKRIFTDPLYKKWGQNTQGEFMRELAQDIGSSLRVLYYAIQFYDKLTNNLEFCTAVQKLGKNASWSKIRALLPKPKTVNIPLPDDKYSVIYADPPWEVKAGPEYNSGEESRDLTYSTMTLEEIKRMPVESIANKDAHLYLWTINKYIEDAYDVARKWGFEPVCLLTWCKRPHGIGLGGTFIQTTEFLLFCKKGVLTTNKRIDTTWWEYKRGKHSVKPEEFRKMIEEVSPGKKIELFAREKTKGWDVWGNEVE